MRTPPRNSLNTRCHRLTLPAALDILHASALDRHQLKAFVRSNLEFSTILNTSATLLRPFSHTIAIALAQLPSIDRAAAKSLRSYGGFNFRNTRGSATLSMHALGLALDLGFDSTLDVPHDNLTDRRYLAVYRAFKAHGNATGEWVFAGMGFAQEDSMHFECSLELLRLYAATGRV